ncbi:peroxide stress protein YaaA [Ruminococcus sp. Marseille-P6503]|uniref:peroxide stress protein YaaA n=1 Tax=Ruminococcus sp. Marseille-P6503 TaxID=2364796 RepID=UPI000F53C788|nr:peroxide stress protein YaaA [Ruminococcus sp. Marseille-P6503]
MRIIISPAKKMRIDTDSLPWEDMPQFLPQTERLLKALQKLSDRELQRLWKCGDSIAELNTERLRTMDLYRNLTPAVLSYEGIQYQYMAPGVFEYSHFDYIQERLRILSGFYGLLKPFDGVTPYRLEMQAKLSVGGYTNLYDFWGDKLAGQLASETQLIIDLASKEYSRAVTTKLPESVRVITCVFGELKNGRVVEKGTLCKMARGQMVRWLAENNVADSENIKYFDAMGYGYNKKYSAQDKYVFLKGEDKNAGSRNKGA